MNNQDTEALNDVALSKFREKPYWGKLYEDAPEGAKRYYRIAFGDSVGAYAGMEIDSTIAREKCFREMDDASWDYVLRQLGSVTLACGLGQMRRRFQGKPWNEGGHLPGVE